MKLKNILLLILILLISVQNVYGIAITKSDNIQYSNDTEYYRTGGAQLTYLLISEINVTNNYTGSWRISFDSKVSGDSWYLLRIYKNDVFWGSTTTTPGTAYSTTTEDFNNIVINSSDKIQLYASSGNNDPASNNVFVRNFRIKFWNDTNLTLISPANSSIVTSPVTLLWTEWNNTNPYTYQIATDYQFINFVTSGSISGTEPNISTSLSLNPGTYYWHVKNTTGAYTNWRNFTISAPTPTPGMLNISVWDEMNMSKQVLIFTAYAQNDTAQIVKSTTTGFANFTAAEIASGEYRITILPTGSYNNYLQRMNIATSPGNVTIYVPNSSNTTIDYIVFSLLDVTGLFPFKTSTITISKGGIVMDKAYFGATGTHPVYLIQGQNYQISIQHGSSIFFYGNYVPYTSMSEQIVTSDFNTDPNDINSFTYNITSTQTQIVLNWNDTANVMSYLNFTVRKGTPEVLLCQLTTSVKHGQSVCGIDNLTSYHIIFSALMTDGTYKNYSSIIDYSVGQRKTSTGISDFDGSPTGIGFVWDYGTFVMPNWVYNGFSMVLLILLAGTFGGYTSGFGAIILAAMALILESVGWFRPIDDNNTQTIVIGLTVALLVLSIVYFLQHKDRGG